MRAYGRIGTIKNFLAHDMHVSEKLSLTFLIYVLSKG